MKNNILFSSFALIAILGMSQGCSLKREEMLVQIEETDAQAALVSAEHTRDLELWRNVVVEKRKLQQEQRRLAILEKAKLSPTYKNTQGNIIYYKAEQDPVYNGGEKELAQYLKDNITYPGEARANGLEGTVLVDFVVDRNGRVGDVVAYEGVGDDVDMAFKEEAVRVVASMTGWRAGRQHGKAVSASFSIPITFELQ
jgi:TonB family protein